jgi:hypothetical protein
MALWHEIQFAFDTPLSPDLQEEVFLRLKAEDPYFPRISLSAEGSWWGYRNRDETLIKKVMAEFGIRGRCWIAPESYSKDEEEPRDRDKVEFGPGAPPPVEEGLELKQLNEKLAQILAQKYLDLCSAFGFELPPEKPLRSEVLKVLWPAGDADFELMFEAALTELSPSGV